MSKRKLNIRTQAVNANQHTPRGMGELERSIGERGWIGAMTVAEDGESFDGSARLEVGAGKGWDFGDEKIPIIKAEPGKPLIIDTDGSTPIIHRRRDIPTADDPRAKLLAIEANRIAELNLSWSPEVLAELGETLDLGGLFSPDEMAAVLERVPGDEDWAGALGDLPDGDRAPFQQMTFTVSDEQAEQIGRALEKAKDAAPFADTGNENSNGNALARICEVYLGIG